MQALAQQQIWAEFAALRRALERLAPYSLAVNLVVCPAQLRRRRRGFLVVTHSGQDWQWCLSQLARPPLHLPLGSVRRLLATMAHRPHHPPQRESIRPNLSISFPSDSGENLPTRSPRRSGA